MDESEDFLEDVELTLGDDEDVSAPDISVDRMITIAPLEAEPIAKALESLLTQSPLERELITTVQELHQLLGDADAYLASKLSDLESGIRGHFQEFASAPGAVLLGILAKKSDEEQLAEINDIMRLLNSRWARCKRNIADKTNDESGRII